MNAHTHLSAWIHTHIHQPEHRYTSVSLNTPTHTHIHQPEYTHTSINLNTHTHPSAWTLTHTSISLNTHTHQPEHTHPSAVQSKHALLGTTESCTILHHSQQIRSMDEPRQSSQTLLQHSPSFTTDSEQGSAPSICSNTPAPFCIIHNRFWAWICFINPPWTLLHHFASFATDSEHGAAQSAFYIYSCITLHQWHQILSLQQPCQPSMNTPAPSSIIHNRFWAWTSQLQTQSNKNDTS